MCNCGCHLTLDSPCCPYCQEQAAPTPKMKLTVADLTKLGADISIENEFTTNSCLVKMVLTPPGPYLDAAALNQQQYGCQIGLSKQLLEENYMAAMEQAHFGLAAEMSAYFTKVGWPAWVLKVLDDPYHAEPPMVQSSYTLPLPKWGHPGGYVGGHTVTGDLEFLLPGLREVVTCPATFPWCTDCYTTTHPEGVALPPCPHGGGRRCDTKQSVQRMIVHLNDQHHWSREVEVADWLESLDVDLSFPSEEEIAERRKAQADAPPMAPTSTISKIMADVYAKQIAFQEAAVEKFTASWHEKSKSSVTFEYHNHLKAWDDPIHYTLDNPAKTVDPLEHKKSAAKHHQQFLHNPTKSKPPKKN